MNHQGHRTAPLTLAQLAMFQALRDDLSAPSTIEVSYRIEGPLDVAAFVASVGEVVQGHDALRLAVCWCGDDGPHQWVRDTPPLAGLVGCRRVKAGTEERFTRYAVGLAGKDASAPWDPRTEYPFRLRLLQYSPQVHAFVATFSQLAVDGSVRAVFDRELWQAYRRRLGDGGPAAEPGPQFLATAEAPDHGPADDLATAEFWRHRFAHLPGGQGLFGDTPAGAAEAGTVELDFALDGERLRSMRSAAGSHRATELVWIQHALVRAVFDRTEADSLALWQPVDTRGLRELRVLGMFTVSLPLVVRRAGSAPELVRALTEEWFAVLEHRRVTRASAEASGAADLGRLVGGPERLVRLAYVGHPRQTVRTAVGDLALRYGTYAPPRERAVDGVHLKAGSWGDRIEFHLTCNRAWFTEDDARQLRAGLERLLVG
ncbi:condensation domain-containing protein [Kitasatospora sp. NPDC002227]|uniref:condensation domain-containing protein n=1 Tax=Kitasatospora sp. NPDC002227 TaxID=3154773 RepID=UPI00331B59DE